MKYSGKPYMLFLCGKKEADAKSGLARYKPQPQLDRSLLQTLAQQNHMQMIEEHKLEQGCVECGFNTDPGELELHFGDLDEADFTTTKLVSFSRKRLRHALKIATVYCARCHSQLHAG